LNLLVKNGALNIDTTDEVIRGCLLTHQGEVLHAGAKDALAASGAGA
jgi:hypothetical protein